MPISFLVSIPATMPVAALKQLFHPQSRQASYNILKYGVKEFKCTNYTHRIKPENPQTCMTNRTDKDSYDVIYLIFLPSHGERRV